MLGAEEGQGRVDALGVAEPVVFLGLFAAQEGGPSRSPGVVTLADRRGLIFGEVLSGRGLLVSSVSPSYRGHRYPVEIISYCVWLYHRFPLSFREVEELMLERGVAVSYETVRRWCLKFGQAYANALRRRRPRPGDKWHLDEVFIKINGELKYLWRAVDQDGNVLDILVQNRRDKAAARRFFRKLLKKTRSVPRVVVTDKIRSYGAAHREVMPSVEHRSHKGLNNGPRTPTSRPGNENAP
ncbi:hypothetical protein GCM10010207_86450 [Streptomyces atratus]|nr:hypothetical protein GCM10010207_86450 [Streptomyces atratus]